MPEEKSEGVYVLHPFVRTYDASGKLNYWSPWNDVCVKASSLEEAIKLGEEKLREEFRRNNLSIGDFLVNSVEEPNGTKSQITSWDESGFPI